jgi:hypothetical protein
MMDERSTQPAPMESRPYASGPGQEGSRGARPLDDPRALTILTTEHWSLLSARGLVYNEAFARGGMFVSFLSATLVALGLVSTATGFSAQFLVVVAVVFGLDLFVGLATLGRVASANSEDIRFLQGMARLRHAYHETVPGLEPYFITSPYDDAPGILGMYGARPSDVMTSSRSLHGFTTIAGMIGVITAAVAAALVAVVFALFGAGSGLVIVVGLITFAIGTAANVAAMRRGMGRTVRGLDPLFPTPDGERRAGPASVRGLE